MFNKSILYPLMLLSLIFFLAGFSSDLAKRDDRVLRLTVGEGNKLISFTFDMGKTEKTQRDNSLILKGVVTDFTLPFNRLKSILKRENLGGDEVINQLEITSQKNKNQTTLIFRLTTKGTGGGMGKIGGSLVVIFNLDKNILKGSEQIINKLPVQGKLAFSDTAFKQEPKYVKEDMSLVGVTSSKYTPLLSAKDKGTFFHGFVVFDPTNPKSKKDAYFEFSISESEKSWTLDQQNDKN